MKKYASKENRKSDVNDDFLRKVFMKIYLSEEVSINAPLSFTFPFPIPSFCYSIWLLGTHVQRQIMATRGAV